MRADSLECIQRTADVLRSELFCDDFRFLPSAEPLRSAFAVLLKYPRVNDWSLAGVLLLGQLNRITGHMRPNRAERAVLESNRLADALQALPSAVAMLGDVKSFTRRLQRVESMNDPWVSLMYWYQRARGSQDYVATQGGDHLKLDRRVAATKEHIVPFSILYRNYDLDARGHSASHVVNAIGNLTMVSGDMNYGHGSDPINLRDVDPGLLRAHHLDDAEVLQRYRATLSAIESASSKAQIRSRYERFVRARTQRLAEGMYGWLVGATQFSSEHPDMRPRPRKMSPSAADQLLQLPSIPGPFKDVLLDIGVRNDGTSWLLYRTPGKYTRSDKIRVDHRCGALQVGLTIPGIDALTEQLDGRLRRRASDGREVAYELRPRNAASLDALRLVHAFVNA